MDRVERNVKARLFDLYKQKRFLDDRSIPWHVSYSIEGKVTREDMIKQNNFEIDILEKVLN